MPQLITVTDFDQTETIAPAGTKDFNPDVSKAPSWQLAIENTGTNDIDSASYEESPGHDVFGPNATIAAALTAVLPVTPGSTAVISNQEENLSTEFNLTLGSTLGTTAHVVVRGIASAS